MEKSPATTQTTIERPTEPVFVRTPLGETKIPDPMTDPTMTVIPLIRFIFGFSSIAPSDSAREMDLRRDPPRESVTSLNDDLRPFEDPEWCLALAPPDPVEAVLPLVLPPSSVVVVCCEVGEVTFSVRGTS